MAIVLTNGKYFIAHDKRGAVIKVSDISQAQDFHSIERAIAQKNKAPGKCAGYYFIDTDIDAEETKEKAEEKTSTDKPDVVKREKRKKFSARERLVIYRKTKGHCYLCGEFIDFDSFEIEHRIPISKGGTNDLSNLFCSCHCCNNIKHNIYPHELMEKITQIFMYQTKKRIGNGIRWKLIQWLMDEKEGAADGN